MNNTIKGITIEIGGDTSKLGKALQNADTAYAMRRTGIGDRMTGNEGSVSTREVIKTCPVCGQIMKKRNGRYGEFWGCSGFPLCRHTEKIRFLEEKTQTDQKI